MFGLESLLVGRTLADRYRIEEVVGRGRTGPVFRAIDVRLGFDVAVKAVTSGAQTAEAVESFRARFQKAATAAARVHHPNVAAVYDCGTDSSINLDFLVMEMLRGEHLGSRLAQRGRPPVPLGVRMLLEAVHGLAAVHNAGIAHGDLRPENLFLTRSEDGKQVRVRLLAFGIAPLAAAAGGAIPPLQATGAAAYVAPEQLRAGAEPRPASDVFSLGAVGFLILTGTAPFSDAAILAMASGQRVAIRSPRELNPDIPPELAAVILRAISADPAARFPDATHLLDALAPLVAGLPLSPAAPAAAARPASPAPVEAPASPPPAPAASVPVPAIFPSSPAAAAPKPDAAPPAAAVDAKPAPAASVESPAVARESTPPVTAAPPTPPASPKAAAPAPATPPSTADAAPKPGEPGFVRKPEPPTPMWEDPWEKKQPTRGATRVATPAPARPVTPAPAPAPVSAPPPEPTPAAIPAQPPVSAPVSAQPAVSTPIPAEPVVPAAAAAVVEPAPVVKPAAVVESAPAAEPVRPAAEAPPTPAVVPEAVVPEAVAPETAAPAPVVAPEPVREAPAPAPVAETAAPAPVVEAPVAAVPVAAATPVVEPPIVPVVASKSAPTLAAPPSMEAPSQPSRRMRFAGSADGKPGRGRTFAGLAVLALIAVSGVAWMVVGAPAAESLRGSKAASAAPAAAGVVAPNPAGGQPTAPAGQQGAPEQPAAIANVPAPLPTTLTPSQRRDSLARARQAAQLAQAAQAQAAKQPQVLAGQPPAAQPQPVQQVAAATPAAPPPAPVVAAPPPAAPPAAAQSSAPAAAEPESVEEPPALANATEVQRAVGRNYPVLLRDAGISGRARVRFAVKEDGTVDPASITVLDASRDAFGDAAKRVLRAARYRPARVNGRAVRVMVTTSFAWAPPDSQ
jgi:TonB family protein